MARPPRIEKLRHGRLLCGSVFRFFVETWNWLVGYVDNMMGDADVNPQSGHITVDRTDPDHPVIRFRADKAAGGGASAALDEASLNTRTSDGKSQIKGWDAASASGTTLAADLKGTSPASGLLIYRDSSGNLSYKSIGTLGFPVGITESGLKVVTDLQWSETNHRLEIEHATFDVENGIITSWAESGDQTISTTSISSILNP